MGRHRLLVATAFAIISVVAVWATPTVHLFKPPPGQYDIEQLWRARVTNPDNTTYTASFEGFVFEETQGQVFHATTKPFPLPPGTRIYMYRDVQIEHTDYAPGYEYFAGETGQLPAGDYTFVLLLNSFGTSDTVEIHVRPMGPPRLVVPRDGDTVTAPYPQFVWTPPSPASPGVTYELKLAEVMPGQTPEEALGANLPWFDQADLMVPSLTYPISAKALDPGQTYAWQVAAVSGSGASITQVNEFYRGTSPAPPANPQLLLSLRPGETLSSAVVVWASVSTGDSLRDCTFSYSPDSVNWTLIGKDKDPTEGWSVTWNTFGVQARTKPAKYFLRAKATDWHGVLLERVVPVVITM